MASIEFRQVVKRYGSAAPAVAALDLHIRDGEFMVLVGPSGCGKSTSLRMIAGLESVSAGELWIGDRLVNDLPPKARNVAMVFQNYALYPHMNVFENMAFGLRVRRQPEPLIKRKVREAAESLGIDELLARKPAQLSGGQRQRVALGRAMVRDPRVFLFDEPLSNLDAELRVQMRGYIARLHRESPTTSVYVTHDQVEAMTLGTRIAILNGGELMQVGTPMALYKDPNSVFVARFMGSPPMNILRVQNSGVTLKNTLLEFSLPGLGALPAELLLGIRPEKFCPAAAGPGQWPRVRGSVEMVETLGAEVLVHLGAGEEKVVARLPGLQSLTPGQSLGQTLELAFDPDSIYLFDAQSRQRIRTR